VLIRVSIDANAPVKQSAYATVASQGVNRQFIQLDDNGESTEQLTPMTTTRRASAASGRY
jgi:hypothetical protein